MKLIDIISLVIGIFVLYHVLIFYPDAIQCLQYQVILDGCRNQSLIATAILSIVFTLNILNLHRIITKQEEE